MFCLPIAGYTLNDINVGECWLIASKLHVSWQVTNYGMKSCGLNGSAFQHTTKVNRNYKPTDCDTPAIFYTMC